MCLVMVSGNFFHIVCLCKYLFKKIFESFVVFCHSSFFNLLLILMYFS